ncbi:MAG: hypothetical protein JNJ61_24200, partial [Anaerolineae bacterium]|nr:hypothetical protein [Anaerolineae bacterium]
SALNRIRAPEMLLARRRGKLRFYRDLAFGSMWLLVVLLLYAMLFSFTASV